MKKNKYTINEIRLLNLNPNVIRVKYGNTIEYNPVFKKWAVIQSVQHPEMSAREIFEMAGFDLDIIGSRTPRDRIRHWKNTSGINVRHSNETKVNESKNLDRQNNALLLILIHKFDRLLEVLGKRYVK